MAALNKQELMEELTPNIRRAIFEIVKHANNIDPKDMENWVQSALRRNPYILNLRAYQNPEYSEHLSDEQIIQKTMGHFNEFLLPRLNFITGTDSAKVTAHRTGIEPGFPGSASTVAEEKLMKIPPLWVDAHLRRGVKLEYLARDLTIEAGYNPRPDLLEAIKQNQQGHPFLRGLPDDLLERTLESGESQFILPDYKVPAKAKGMALHDYVMQLHHYTLCNIIGNQYHPENRVDIHGLKLFEVSLDKFKVIETPIAWDETFAQAILEEGAMVHEHFIQGRVPEIAKPTKHFSLAADAYVAQQMSAITKLKVMGEVIEQKVASHQMNLTNYIENRAPDRDCRIEHDTLTVTTKRKPSLTDEHRDELIHQYEINADGKTNYKIDQEIMKVSKERGDTLNVPFETTFKVGFSTKKVDRELRMTMATKVLPEIDGMVNPTTEQAKNMEAELGEISTLLTSEADDMAPATIKRPAPATSSPQPQVTQEPQAAQQTPPKREVEQASPKARFNF